MLCRQLRHDGAQAATENILRYPIADLKVAIRMGSIHGVKGKTHTATLVLESFNRTHNLRNLKAWLLGKRPKAGSDNQAQQPSLRDRLKLHYVGMTRASHFLCLAMRQDTFTAAEIDQLQVRGWNIEICATVRQPTNTRRIQRLEHGVIAARLSQAKYK